MKLEAGTKVRVISNTRPHHHLSIGSAASVISSNDIHVDLIGKSDDGKELRQILCFNDIEILKQKGILL